MATSASATNNDASSQVGRRCRTMIVRLRNPRRDIEIQGPRLVKALLDELGVNRESVLVIRGDTLVVGDAMLADSDVVEIRPVISGGSP